jgi:hypothetical protein
MLPLLNNKTPPEPVPPEVVLPLMFKVPLLVLLTVAPPPSMATPCKPVELEVPLSVKLPVPL